MKQSSDLGNNILKLTKEERRNHLVKSINVYDYKVQLQNGNLKLMEIYEKTPATLASYLEAVRPLMSHVIYPQEEIKENDPNYQMKIWEKVSNGFEPIKTKEPNETWIFMRTHCERLQKMIDERNDLRFPYISIVNMEKSYLLKNRKEAKLLERPQHMFIRVACALHSSHGQDLEKTFKNIEEAYVSYATFRRMPASPTLYNAGLTIQQMSSCFLVRTYDDLPSILWLDMIIGTISKAKGATGFSVGDCRGAGASIGNSGVCSGTLGVYKRADSTTAYVSQGGERPGASQGCHPVWHSDYFSFMDMFRQTGNEDLRVKKLFGSTSTHDLFWRRVEANKKWSLFNPVQFYEHDIRINDLYGKEFTNAYVWAEENLAPEQTFDARKIFHTMAEILFESGKPFIIQKDFINRKSNMKNIGPIVSLNLCQEIALPADRNRIPSCNLTSLPLLAYVDREKRTFDWRALAINARKAVRDLNRVIERNYHPLPQIKFANDESAPIGIGFQGAFSALQAMDILFDSKASSEWQEKVVACTYYNALMESCQMAKERESPYPAFEGSPFSKGKFQFDLWNDELEEMKSYILTLPQDDRVPSDETLLAETPHVPLGPSSWGQEGSWDELRCEVMKYGVVNSQLTTSQPTASVSTLTNMSPSWEPYERNAFVHNLNSGTYVVVNNFMQDDLTELGLWHEQTVEWLRFHSWSLQGISEAVETDDPEIIAKLKHLEKKYRTVREYDTKLLLDHARTRAPYIDGSQSTNLFVQPESKPEQTIELIQDALLHANRLRLKTLCYYLETGSAKSAIKTVRKKVKDTKLKFVHGQIVRTVSDSNDKVCLRENPDCLACQ